MVFGFAIKKPVHCQCHVYCLVNRLSTKTCNATIRVPNVYLLCLDSFQENLVAMQNRQNLFAVVSMQRKTTENHIIA
jgi:hypothetical protein